MPLEVDSLASLSKERIGGVVLTTATTMLGSEITAPQNIGKRRILKATKKHTP